MCIRDRATPGGVQARHVVDTVTYGSLAMDSFRFEGAGAIQPPLRAAA